MIMCSLCHVIRPIPLINLAERTYAYLKGMATYLYTTPKTNS